MENVPNIVRERLKAATSDLSANHPDADVLTAFAEHSLARGQRDVVLEHLARCGDCREIVALALPAMETVETVTRPAARGWLTWPALRWGLAAAGVVAITSLGIVQYRHSAAPQNLAAKLAAPVEVAANQPKQQSLDTSVPAAPATNSDKVQPRRNTVLSAPNAFSDSEKKSESVAGSPPIPLPEARAVNGGALPTSAEQLPHGPRVANQWQQNLAQNQASPAAPMPSAKQQATGDQSAQMQAAPSPETVEVESAAVQAGNENKNLDAGKVQDLPSVRQPATEEYALARVGKAKPALTAPGSDVSAAAVAPLAPSGTAGATLASSTPVPSWSISSSGTLQRSYDQGATWQVVDVNASRSIFDLVNVQSAAKSSRADRKDALKRDTATPNFRALAVNAADVWAGGSHGTLYHSSDAGDHWTRVLPASSGVALTGDIVSLEFVDPQHGKVSTSTPENWITSDGGQTWQKQ